MAGRRIQNEQDARKCLAAVESTRGGLADWARAHGIDGRSLNLWRMNLARRDRRRGQPVVPKLVELVPAVTASARTAGYVLHVGGVELEIAEDFSETSLHRLIGLLKSC